MRLMDYPFDFCKDDEQFGKKYGKLLSQIIGQRLIRFYKVWDNLEGIWFSEAPILIEFDDGYLAIQVRSGTKVAAAWNDIKPTINPVWFDNKHDVEHHTISWFEDLCWREIEVDTVESVSEINMIVSGNELVGLLFILETHSLGVILGSEDSIILTREDLRNYMTREGIHRRSF